MSLKEDHNTPSNTHIQVTFAVLFFMWGLLTVMHSLLLDHLISLFELSYSISLLIDMFFFAAYLIVSLKAGTLIQKIGYKKGILVGWILCLIGCFVFVISVATKSFYIFLAALFIQASGITILQVGANLYVVLNGNPHTGASRLNFVQAFNSLGTFLPPLLIIEHFIDIEKTQIYVPYLVLGCAMTLFAVYLWKAKIPQINIENKEPLNLMPFHPRRHVMHFPQLRLGAFAIFAYVGTEVAIANYLQDFAEEFRHFYWGSAMVGRFIGASLLTKISPHKAVGFSASIAGFLVITSIFTSGLGVIPIWAMTAIGLFNSILFPSIFALGVNGLGRFSLDGSAVLIMSIVGGAVIPFMVRNFSQMKDFPHELSHQLALIIPVICYFYIFLYGIKLSKFRKRKDHRALT